MKKILIVSCMIAVTVGFMIKGTVFATGGMLTDTFPAPEFTHGDKEDWINSEPLSINDLQGKVVLIDFWTFDCWNCYRSFPWMNAMEHRLAQEDFLIIGVHTPEFAHERIRENIVAKAREFKLHHPIMIDNDSSYWRAMRNRYWPAFYILDKKGAVRAVFFGETHEGDSRAKQIEAGIRDLLAEPS